MNAAFVEAFREGVNRVVIIGSDCPALTAEDLEQAWRALDTRDVVLGPATDGGYWLIGLREPQSALFERIAWSTSTVLAETIDRAHRTGLRVGQLRQLTDVDTEADWLNYLSSLPENQGLT